MAETIGWPSCTCYPALVLVPFFVSLLNMHVMVLLDMHVMVQVLMMSSRYFARYILLLIDALMVSIILLESYYTISSVLVVL